jgi:hypothetical protein
MATELGISICVRNKTMLWDMMYRCRSSSLLINHVTMMARNMLFWVYCNNNNIIHPMGISIGRKSGKWSPLYVIDVFSIRTHHSTNHFIPVHIQHFFCVSSVSRGKISYSGVVCLSLIRIYICILLNACLEKLYKLYVAYTIKVQ